MYSDNIVVWNTEIVIFCLVKKNFRPKKVVFLSIFHSHIDFPLHTIKGYFYQQTLCGTITSMPL